MSSIPSQQEYEEREAREFRRQMSAADKGSLAERREAAASFAEALRDPALVAERVRWLMEGCFGHGAMQAARGIVEAKRMNRAAALTQIVCALDFLCPVRAGIAEWKKLAPAEKTALAAAVNREIEKAEVRE